MIMYVMGNLFQSPAQVLVNTVNTVGVMGKGVAFEFKRLFPEMFVRYRELCERGEFKVGQLWLYRSPNKWVLNFPTKKHWRHPSRVEYITAGLKNFASNYAKMGIYSIAFPPLGCGHGHLDFETEVQPEMQRHLGNLPIDVFIYPTRNDPFFVPEHENPGEMRKWLRSEPTSLPFSEVWDDLVDLLKRQDTFKTLTKGSPFTARITPGRSHLSIAAAGDNRYHIAYETLLDFWQQLRTYGFSMRQIAPGMDRQMSYVVPIFGHLPYVKPVRVAKEYGKLAQSSVVGLQVLPQAFDRRLQQEQLPLVELT